MKEQRFSKSGWAVPEEHSGRCGNTAAVLFGQTLWRWGEPGKGTVLDDVEDGCLLCLAQKVERLLDQGWGLSGERFTRIVKR
ncbi:MAG: hypothetical protein V3W41_20275 [Planctomycetota bacterium]